MSRPWVHGTPGGYTGHRRRDQEPCEACRFAMADSKRAFHITSRSGKTVQVPAGLLGRLLREADDETTDLLYAVIGPLTAEACMEVAGLEDLSAAAKENAA